MRLLSVLGVVMALISSTGPVWSAETAVDMDVFPLGVYWPWERVQGLADRCGMDKWTYVEDRLNDMKAHNVDAVWVVNLGIKDLPDLAQRVGDRQMKLVPALGELHYNIPWRLRNWDYLGKQSRAAIEAAGDSPAILAWALCDEPRNHFVGEMETYRRKFTEWGAKQPGIVVTMWHDTPAYAQEADFPVLCPDIYPFFATGNPNGPNTPDSSRSWYRRHALTAARLGYENGQIPWIMPQSFSDVWGPWKYDAQGNTVMLPGGLLHWRVPTVGETRWQVWCAVAAGVRGFFWFPYAPPPTEQPDAKPYEGKAFPPDYRIKEEHNLGFSGALIRPDGSATPQYTATAEAFGALRPLIPLLKGSVAAEIPLAEVDAPGWVGTLHNPTLNRTFAVLVNDDTDEARDVRLWLVKPNDLKNLRTGETLHRATDNSVTIRLEPGDGTVLEAVE